MFPLHILIANFKNYTSIPSYLVPNGGFIITKSTGLIPGFIPIVFAFAKINS